MTTYTSWKNILLYQSIWFGSVLGQTLFVGPVVLLICLHFYLCDNRRDELLVVFVCASFGIFGDSMLALLGTYEFSTEPVLLKIPLWLVAIWVGFTTTLRHGLSFLVGRPWLAVPVAGVGAPIVYMAASRFGAVTFPYGEIKTCCIVSSMWILQMWLFIVVIREVSRHSEFALKKAPVSTVGS